MNAVKKGKISLYYMIYLVGVIVLFLFSATYFQGIVSIGHLIRLLDYGTIISILCICILLLFCAKLLKSFAHSFLYIFGKKKLTTIEFEHAILSIKTVLLGSVVFGIFKSTIEIIKVTYVLEDPSSIGIAINLSLLPIYYSAFLWLILLPIQILLKKDILAYRNSKHE